VEVHTAGQEVTRIPVQSRSTRGRCADRRPLLRVPEAVNFIEYVLEYCLKGLLPGYAEGEWTMPAV
jgi:hypothetical protein